MAHKKELGEGVFLTCDELKVKDVQVSGISWSLANIGIKEGKQSTPELVFDDVSFSFVDKDRKKREEAEKEFMLHHLESDKPVGQPIKLVFQDEQKLVMTLELHEAIIESYSESASDGSDVNVSFTVDYNKFSIRNAGNSEIKGELKLKRK